MVTLLVRRVVPVLGMAVLLGLAARRAVLPPPGGDLWFHLRLGEEFLGPWSVSDPGHLGVFDSADWVATQWLSQVTMAAIERTAGLAGVLLLFAALHMLVLAAIYLLARRVAAPLPACIATSVGLVTLAPWMTARPQVLSYLLLTIVVGAWLATARDGKVRYWLIAVIWAWVPLHGMWPVGIVVSLAMAAGIALDRRLSPPALARLLSVPAGSAVVALMTPLGPGVYSGVLVVGSRSRYFEEWGPPSFTSIGTLGAAIMLATVTIRLVRRGGTPWATLALLGCAGACTVLSLRTLPLAVVMLAPLFAEVVQERVPRAGPVNRAEVLALVGAIAVVLAALTAVLPSRAAEDVVPRWLDERLDAAQPGTRVLDSWDSGPYFLWRHPRLDLVAHGYGDVFTDGELRRNADIMTLQPDWEEEVTGLDPDLAVVDTDSALAYALRRSDGWEVVESDDDFTLLAPTGDRGLSVGDDQ